MYANRDEYFCQQVLHPAGFHRGVTGTGEILFLAWSGLSGPHRMLNTSDHTNTVRDNKKGDHRSKA